MVLSVAAESNENSLKNLSLMGLKFWGDGNLKMESMNQDIISLEPFKALVVS